MKKNEKGSSLIYAVVVIMILSVVITAALAISYTYYNRSIANNSKRQAYLTAKSVITNIVDHIVEEKSDTGEYTSLIPDEYGSVSYGVSDYPKEMGEIKQINYTYGVDPEDTEKVILTISVNAMYGGKTITLNADLMKYKDNQSSYWQLSKYYEGETPVNENVSNAIKMREKMLAVNEIKSDINKVKELFISDTDSYNRFLQSKQTMLTYYNNDPLRKYFFYGYYASNFPIFNKSILSVEQQELLDSADYYIQPFFNHSNYEICLIYANHYNSSVNQWATNLIFNYEDNHWYFLKTQISMTIFNDKAGNSGGKKWKEFVEYTLNDTEKAIRLD